MRRSSLMSVVDQVTVALFKFTKPKLIHQGINVGNGPQHEE